MLDIFKKLFKKKNSKQHIKTFTKVWVNRLLILLCIWVTWTYVLATIATFMMLDAMIIQSLVELSNGGITAIITTCFSYMLKSFFETREEEKNKIHMQELGIDDAVADREFEDNR